MEEAQAERKPSPQWDEVAIWQFLRDETGTVIRERIHRWRWRTLRNSATGGVRYKRGPLTVQWEHGAGQIKLGRLLFIRCASKHPYQWMLIWRTNNYPVWHGSLQRPDKYPMPWTIIRKARRGKLKCLSVEIETANPKEASDGGRTNEEA
jgi:hypothetical protein